MWNAEERFEGFGPSPLDPFSQRELFVISAIDRTALRGHVRQHLPVSPGVYGMLDGQDRLIYVGKSKALRSRVLSYFNPVAAKEKAGRILEVTRRIVWEKQPTEFAALLREQQLIRRWVPRWNVQEVPKRQRPVYVCLGRGPAATLFLARLPPQDVLAMAGPFHGLGRMSRAVDGLNKFFRLRDCKSSQTLYFSGQLSLFDIDPRPGCLRFELGSCSGPCAAGVSFHGYQRQVAAAKRFLEGGEQGPVEELRGAMERAALDLNFEYAARLRDDLRSLEYLQRKLQWLADARRLFTFVYAAGSYDDVPLWYFIRGGEVCDVLVAPKCPKTFAQIRSKLKQWHAQSTSATGQGPFPFTLPLVASWFRKHREELQRTFPAQEAGQRYRSLMRQAGASA